MRALTGEKTKRDRQDDGPSLDLTVSRDSTIVLDCKRACLALMSSVLCRLGINQFADWSHEEFVAIMLPNRGLPRPQLWPEGHRPVTYERTIADEDLPQAVDWRGSLADSPVKDQAMCGSCWVTASPSNPALLTTTHADNPSSRLFCL